MTDLIAGTSELSPSSKLVSIVVPCLNEESVIGEFVDWCFEGFRKAGVEGQVLIVDSSTDRSPEIARAHGAQVLQVPKRGLGQAYLDAIPHIRGQYVIMGDADLTYDFREIGAFVKKLDEGYEFVMGTRMKGDIEAGAMPALHRYFGTPLTTWILNAIYKSGYSDIHCGMRAMTLDALRRIDLQSTSWEYASEMVLKASRLRLRTTEVPIKFYKDREGRQSHHKRSGWLSPWRAGWMNLRVMLVFAPDFFLFWPGIMMLVAGLVMTMGLLPGPLTVFGIGFNLHWMLLGVTLATVGYSGLQLAMLAKVFYNFKPHVTQHILRLITYNRGVVTGALLMGEGLFLGAVLVAQWISSGFRFEGFSHPAVFGLLLVIMGFQTLTYTLILQMMVNSRKARESQPVLAGAGNEDSAAGRAHVAASVAA